MTESSKEHKQAIFYENSQLCEVQAKKYALQPQQTKIW